MPDSVRLDIACLLGHSTWSECKSVISLIEAKDQITGIWVNDHLSPIGPDTRPIQATAIPKDHAELIGESWTTISAIAASTTRSRLGVMASSAILRSPQLLAHMASTVNKISKERVDLAIGAAWNKAEYEANGLTFPPLKDRASAVSATCSYLRDARANRTASPFYGTTPELWVAGKGERYMLPVAARWADWWNIGTTPPEEVASKRKALADHLLQLERDPDSVGISSVVRLHDVLSLQEFRGRLCDLITAGVRHIVIEIRAIFDDLRRALDLVDNAITDINITVSKQDTD